MSDFTEAELEQLHQQMLAIKQQLLNLLGTQHQKAEPVALDQQAVGRVSRIDAIQQQQMAKANEQHTGQRLVAINGALQRFNELEYGYCEQCGEPIKLARLQIKPEAEYCVACQAEHD